MPISNDTKEPRINRESEKRDDLVAQIKRNQEIIPKTTKNKKYKLHSCNLYEVSSYSTKTLTTDDQFLLAIDKIAFPEIKSAFEPRYIEKENETTMLDFISTFSLNKGDKSALSKIIKKFPNKKNEQYRFLLGEKYQGYALTVSMSSATSQKISFRFDLEVPEEKNNPKLRTNPISSEFSVLFNTDGLEYTPNVIWKYQIMIHVKDLTLPDDNSLKELYAIFQLFIRAALSFLKITPSKLSK